MLQISLLFHWIVLLLQAKNVLYERILYPQLVWDYYYSNRIR